MGRWVNFTAISPVGILMGALGEADHRHRHPAGIRRAARAGRAHRAVEGKSPPAAIPTQNDPPSGDLLHPNFWGVGRRLTDAEGRYGFTTIKSGALLLVQPRKRLAAGADPLSSVFAAGVHLTGS